MFVSKESGYGIKELEAELKDRNNIFAGQSGGGNQRSECTDANIGHWRRCSFWKLRTGSTHHHSSSVCITSFCGDLIDSPGVREFGLWHLEPDEVTDAFIEFKPYLGGCKFRL